jgi:hypothetical protein
MSKITDYAMVGVAGLAAADTILNISPTNIEKQPKAKWKPDASYMAEGAKQLNIYDRDYTLLTDTLFVEKPLITKTNEYTHWSILKVNGIDVPGKATINVSFSRDINKPKLAGYDYSDILDNGSNPKQINISLLMNAFDYAAYLNAIQPILAVKSSNAGYSEVNHGLLNEQLENVITLENSLLSDYGISRVVLETISQSSPEIGMTSIDLGFVEYKTKIKRPERPKPSKKIGNNTGVKQGAATLIPDGKNKYSP